MEQELLKKLRYKEGTAVVLNAPDGYQLGLGSSAEEACDFVLLFVHSKQELDEWLPKTIASLKDDAVFWISYPKITSKMKSDLNRDILANLVWGETPYRPVSNVAIDEKWSALRFRPEEKVKGKK